MTLDINISSPPQHTVGPTQLYLLPNPNNNTGRHQCMSDGLNESHQASTLLYHYAIAIKANCYTTVFHKKAKNDTLKWLEMTATTATAK